MPRKKLPPELSGAVLPDEPLKPMGISEYRLAKDISVPRAGSTRSFTASKRFWQNLQARHELEAERDRLGDRLTTEVRVLAG